MNEFLEQFLIEARELIDQATADLLALEEQPDDRERLDSAFRAIHTLKGAAGIVEFAAMGRAMHAAEDVLSRVRTGDFAITAALIGDCLASLDQVVQWLDVMQAEEKPPAEAEAQADRISASFAHLLGAAPAVVPASAPDALGDQLWVDKILAQHPDVAGQAQTAIRYAPAADSFFKGEDPLARFAFVPGLLALDISSAATQGQSEKVLSEKAWPRLDDFDPYRCQMILTALSSAAPDDVRPHFEPVDDQVEIHELRARQRGAIGTAFSDAARALIEAQIRLLSESGVEGLAGRCGSAARVAASVLCHCGRDVDAARIEQLSASSAPQRLQAALAEILAGGSLDKPDDPLSAKPIARPDTQETVTSLRVNVERIDTLVKLVGELLVTKNAIGHIAGLVELGAERKTLAISLKDQHEALDQLLRQLRSVVVGLRVLPVRHVFQRFPKLVREMAAGVGKSARLVTQGDATEADKVIVEALFEPLLHVLRNAVDHGVETREQRAARGKASVATIFLRAARQADHFIVEVQDDGKGIDVERVRKVAIDRGLASGEKLAAMSRSDVVDLIFEPGFSTAAGVTDLSGRGVGMDVVRAAVNRLGGRVEIESLEQQGTTVRFTLPFSIMMTRIMTVEAGGQMFGLALESIVETLRLPRDQIMPLGLERAFVVRDRTVPLLSLSECLGSRDLGSLDDTFSPVANIVVASLAGEITGLEVDRIGEQMEIMLQPMEGLLSDLPAIAGTTLLGDGRVLLILDLQVILNFNELLR